MLQNMLRLRCPMTILYMDGLLVMQHGFCAGSKCTVQQNPLRISCCLADPKITKYHQAWRKGIWVGKDAMDQDLVVYSQNRLVRSKAVRLCVPEYDGGVLSQMQLEVMVLKKNATHEGISVKLRELPAPLPQLPLVTVDEEAKAVEDYANEHLHSDEELESSPGRGSAEIHRLWADPSWWRRHGCSEPTYEKSIEWRWWAQS